MVLIRILALILFSGTVISFAGMDKHPAVTSKEKTFCLPELSDGDIILREGKGFISEMMKATSATDKRFSHAGVVVFGKNGPLVAHFIGTPESPGNAFKLEPIDSFIRPDENLSFAVYRYDLSENEKAAIRNDISLMKGKQIRFDEAFDLETDSALYCTEFIYKTYLKTMGRFSPLGHTATPAGTYVGLDDLYYNRNCKTITEIRYAP